MVAPAQAGPQLVAKLNGLPGAPLRARVVASEHAARAGLRDASLSAALLVNPSGTQTGC